METETGELQAAKRLVAMELETAYVHHDQLVGNRIYPTRGLQTGEFMPDKEWRTHEAILALHLDPDTWKMIARCMRSVAITRLIIEMRHPGGR